MNISKTVAVLAILISSIHISCGDNVDKKESTASEELKATTGSSHESDREKIAEDLKQIASSVDEELNNDSEELEDTVEEETKLSSKLTKGSENWDALLKSYEGYIDNYIKLMKKAKRGDLTAMASYTEYMQKAMDLQEKIEEAKGDLSVSQAAKLLKLQSKLAQAAAEIY